MRIIFSSLTSFLLFCILSEGSLFGCTGMKIPTQDGKFVHGRTLEFGQDLEVEILFIPRAIAFIGTTDKGPGLSYKSKYAAVGAMALGIPLLMDGINEKGLAAGVFYFPTFASYTPLTSENQESALSPIDFCNWILTQFPSVDEVKRSLEETVVVGTTFKEWGNETPPFHYIVYDIEGKAIVIEPLEGKLTVFDNPLGTFTNSPEFPWHMTNLRNFIHLSPMNAEPIHISGMELKPLGQGSGMVGLPGDFTPPSRFVRAAAFSQAAIPLATTEEAIFNLFHLLNQFDIPKGIAKEVQGGKTVYDYTSITAARDPFTLRYYFKTYNDPTIKRVELKKLDPNGAAIQVIPTLGKEKAIDVTYQKL